MEHTLGAAITALRKKNNMTQLQLAEKLGVTDKAVSKWERDLSCPDVHTLPRLAELFGVSVDELMQVRQPEQSKAPAKKPGELIPTILRAVALAMGVAVVVLSVLEQLDTKSAMTMLGLGLACLAATMLPVRTDSH